MSMCYSPSFDLSFKLHWIWESCLKCLRKRLSVFSKFIKRHTASHYFFKQTLGFDFLDSGALAQFSINHKKQSVQALSSLEFHLEIQEIYSSN